MIPSRDTPSISDTDDTLGNAAHTNSAELAVATVLRTRTAPFHRDTEAAYAGFDLTEACSYTRFLQAHVRAVAAAERALSTAAGLPAWRPRMPFLRDDLVALGAPIPDPLPFPAALDAGRAWGVLYVLEGSRIGSEMLGRGVGPGLPCSYLAQRHGSGEWRGFRTALGTALAGDDLLLESAVGGAIACFALFATAARSATSWNGLAGGPGERAVSGSTTRRGQPADSEGSTRSNVG